MRNHVQRGDTLPIIVPIDVTSGSVLQVDGIVGVVNAHAMAGTECEITRYGVFELPKAAGEVWSTGDRVYYTEGDAFLRLAGGALVGCAVQDAGSEDVLAYVLLDGAVRDSSPIALIVVPDSPVVGEVFTVIANLQDGVTLSSITATAGGTPITLTGSGNTRTGTAPAEAGPLVVTATGADAEGNPLTANRTVQVREEPVAPTAPGQFATSDWSVTTGLAASQVVLNVSALPSDGGSPITALQYTVDGGSTWTALSGTGTGSRTLTMPAAGTAYTFALRAVNAVGAGAASATKGATSGAEEPVSTLRKNFVWAFGDSRTRYTQASADGTGTNGTSAIATTAGADGGWMAILQSREANRFAFKGLTAVGGWTSTQLLAAMDAGIAAALAAGCGTATLLIGVNDMAGNTDAGATVPAQTITNINTIVQKILDAGITPVIMNEWPTSGYQGATNKPLIDWYNAQRTVNAWPGAIWADTAGALDASGDGSADVMSDFAVGSDGTSYSTYHVAYSGAEKIATALQAAFATAIPTVQFNAPLLVVDKDNDPALYASDNPTMAGTTGSLTSGITGVAPTGMTLQASPTLAGTDLAAVAAMSVDADGENVLTLTINGTSTASTAFIIGADAAATLPTQETLAGKAFALAGEVDISDISAVRLFGIQLTLTGGGVIAGAHNGVSAGTTGSVAALNGTGSRKFRFLTTTAALAPTGNPTNVRRRLLFTLPAGTYTNLTIALRRFAAGFVPAADYVAP